MLGRRVYSKGPHELEQGEYVNWNDEWYAHCPAPDEPLANLSAHEVTEHEDGTITVAPSILVNTSRNGRPVQLFHGYLERGIWRIC